MKRLPLVLVAAVVALGADDGWVKVKELKSGSELKVWKKGASQPMEAIYDDLGAENLLVVLKNEQVAIPKEGIERIDARPSGRRDRPKVESGARRRINNPSTVAAPQGDQKTRTLPGATTTVSSTVSWDKRPYETVYGQAAAKTGR